MTTKQLIEKLSELPPDLTVYRNDYGSLEPVEVHEVSVANENFIERYYIYETIPSRTETIILIA